MIRRLVRDESGMTMGLTVIMIVLIGVMGAGLLTFVQNDLSSVIESNQGQTALNLADAGVQAAKRHLLIDANVRNYDGDPTTGTAPGGESPWSCVDDASNVCTAGSGKLIDLGAGAGTSTRVWIKYLEASDTPSELSHPDHAPEMVPTGKSDYEFGRDFFKVISEGRAGNARRKIEAIYQTYDLGAPRAYFSQGNITLSGTADVEHISVFSLLNVTVNGGASVSGEDYAYGNWLNSPWNTRDRSTLDAGIGAVGTINKKDPGDYDSTSTNPTFIKKVPPDAAQNYATQITFPFNYQREPDIGMMREAAKLQGNYYEVPVTSDSASVQEAGSGPKWPTTSDQSTVVFVKFMNEANMATNNLTWDVDRDSATDECAPPDAQIPRGTLVVENGTFSTSQQKAPLRGTIVIKGAGPGTEVYKDVGGTCMEAFIHATGDLKLAGTIRGFTQEKGNRPGFFGVRLFSWRECYSATCT
jgi:hypothetical protein